MLRNSLDRQIHYLQDEILLLGSMVERAMLNSLDALKRRDLGLASNVIKDDQLVNDRRYSIENAILILFATQQPVAHDLRLLVSMLEIIVELERMGDYGKGNAQIVRRLGDYDNIPIRELTEMGDKSVAMLHRALDAFIRVDSNQSYIIFKEDDAVDDLYKTVERMVFDKIIANPKMIDTNTLILWFAHNIERMADRVTNICERTIFIATGELIELTEPDEDDPE
jgi:phosphate transport system protein